jgi:uncharacterized OB-fold protein
MTESLYFPPPVLGLYDTPMWASIQSANMKLQKCSDCGAFRYPPGPCCHECVSERYEWTPISGHGKILSWVVFHRTYFSGYPAPYNVIAVQLQEGPIMISNLIDPPASGSWIELDVSMVYETIADGRVLPRFKREAAS